MELQDFGQGFESKFSVLKVAQKQPRGLFTNSSNLMQSSFSSFHSTMSVQMPMPQNSFQLSPLQGFDEEEVIVPKRKQRNIAKIPYKVLDAPALQDDFYLNLVDWSSCNNLAVGLSNCVYIWSASSSRVTKLHDLGPRDCVTSVHWSKRGSHLSVGTHSGMV